MLDQNQEWTTPALYLDQINDLYPYLPSRLQSRDVDPARPNIGQKGENVSRIV